jgi:hypothetical protein
MNWAKFDEDYAFDFKYTVVSLEADGSEEDMEDEAKKESKEDESHE